MGTKTKTPPPLGWMMGAIMGSTAMVGAWMWDRYVKDKKAFEEYVQDKGITDPLGVWKACCRYHDQVKKELAEAKAKVQAGEEIVRVGVGLAKVRVMLEEGSKLPFDLRIRQMMGEKISDAEMNEALKKIEKNVASPEVKQVIIAHWWSELIKLFVPWGIVLPDEIQCFEKPVFRLVDKEVAEAVLRSEVFKLKEMNKSLNKIVDKQIKQDDERYKELRDKEKAWREERKELLEEIDALKKIEQAYKDSKPDEID